MSAFLERHKERKLDVFLQTPNGSSMLVIVIALYLSACGRAHEKQAPGGVAQPDGRGALPSLRLVEEMGQEPVVQSSVPAETKRESVILWVHKGLQNLSESVQVKGSGIDENALLSWSETLVTQKRLKLSDARAGIVLDELPAGPQTVTLALLDRTKGRYGVASQTVTVVPGGQVPLKMKLDWVPLLTQEKGDLEPVADKPADPMILLPFVPNWTSSSRFFNTIPATVSLGLYSLGKGFLADSLRPSQSTVATPLQMSRQFAFARSNSQAVLIAGQNLEIFALDDSGKVTSSIVKTGLNQLQYVTYDSLRKKFILGGLGSEIYELEAGGSDLRILLSGVRRKFKTLFFEPVSKTYFATEVVQTVGAAQQNTEEQLVRKFTWEQLMSLNQDGADLVQGSPVPEAVVQSGNFAPVWSDSVNGRILYTVPKKLNERGKDPSKVLVHIWLNSSDLSWKLEAE